jgi:hypothetical protein
MQSLLAYADSSNDENEVASSSDSEDEEVEKKLKQDRSNPEKKKIALPAPGFAADGVQSSVRVASMECMK